MSRIVIAWELGDNFGHLWPLVPIAGRLASRGHQLVFAVRDVALAGSVLTPRGLPFLPCPAPAKRLSLERDLMSYADILAVSGFGAAAHLDGMTDAWKTMFSMFGADLVVAEHAPSALVTARALGLPTVHVGTGFTIPPQVSPMPCFRSWAKRDPAPAVNMEAAVLSGINRVFARNGKVPAATLAKALTADAQLLLSLPELDHYHGAPRGEHRYLGPVSRHDSGEPAAWRQSGLPHVFLYLRDKDWLPAVLEAVAARQVEAIAVIPDIPEPLLRQYHGHPRLRISRHPLHLQTLLPDCRLAVTSAGHGTAMDCLLHGVPMLLLPNHIEQLLVTSRLAVQKLALGILPEAVAAQFGSVFDTMLADEGYRERAQALAQRHAGVDPDRTLDEAVRAIEAAAAARTPS